MMADIKVYDKVSWHFPEGKNCPSLEAAKRHFVEIMDWLKTNNLLSEAGLEIYEIGIDSDFAITSDMLSEKGNKIFRRSYTDWLKTVEYGQTANLNMLNNQLLKI